MIKIHREGRLITNLSASLLLAGWAAYFIYSPVWLLITLLALSIIFAWIVHFFRNPVRSIPKFDDGLIYAPADGKIVVIEKVIESEHFKDERRLVSIFMSPMNVHVNRAPTTGVLKVIRHHKGKFLAAWDPKSSTDNERSTIVLEGKQTTVLLRQVAGAMARRIITYGRPGDHIQQGEELGFIRFGSRVDIYLPLSATIKVDFNEKVFGNKTVIAEL